MFRQTLLTMNSVFLEVIGIYPLRILLHVYGQVFVMLAIYRINARLEIFSRPSLHERNMPDMNHPM